MKKSKPTTGTKKLLPYQDLATCSNVNISKKKKIVDKASIKTNLEQFRHQARFESF